MKKHQITKPKLKLLAIQKRKLDYSHDAKINSGVSAREAGRTDLGTLLKPWCHFQPNASRSVSRAGYTLLVFLLVLVSPCPNTAQTANGIGLL